MTSRVRRVPVVSTSVVTSPEYDTWVPGRGGQRRDNTVPVVVTVLTVWTVPSSPDTHVNQIHTIPVGFQRTLLCGDVFT